MNKAGHKSLSVIFTSLIIISLVFMGPASAINLIISEPNDARQGEDVEFTVTVDLNSPDMYLPIAYTTLIFTDSEETTFECKVYNDGTTDCDNIDVTATFDLTYGEGPQFGYGYGYDQRYGYGYDYTYFGYGYGYGYAGEDGQITYDVTLHLDDNAQTGEYTVRAETYAIVEDSNDDNQGFGYCGTMLGMYNEHFLLQTSTHDSLIDFNEDERIDLIDVSLLASEHGDDAELFGRVVEYCRYVSSGSYNSELDVNLDGVINATDFEIFMLESVPETVEGEQWCADQISFIPGVERVYISGEQAFDVSSRPVTEPQPGSGGGRYSGGTNNTLKECGEGYVRDELTGFCLLEKTTEEEPFEYETSSSEEENGNVQGSDSTGIFSAITGAVVGAGESLGLGETFSYLLTLFLFALVISGIVRISRKRK